MAKVKTRYVCQNCGYVSPRYLGRCPNCSEWNTLIEEVEQKSAAVKATPRVTLTGTTNAPQKIDTIKISQTPRVDTKNGELNRVLGGGVVPGSMVLIGGDPGIGKSTLLLQVSGSLSDQGGKLLYVSGEESANQIKMRAQRLGVSGSEFYLYPETDMGSILQNIEDLKPDYVIIDSVQTMQMPEVTSAVGSVAQIREVTAALMQVAKTNGITIFIVGHVTKGGAIAGPKILEHMVDTVLYFEGDMHRTYRILRAVKNRFGST
ncbi:MAG TPA: DNA repair protein RadA, partial [Lactobacillus sp.]|nr:DNA repair protein RadA [Lactobacillus sp.]